VTPVELLKRKTAMAPESEESQRAPLPEKQDENPFEAFLGVLSAFSSVEKINAWTRDLRDDEGFGPGSI
jgi:cell division septation protein DedD